VWVADTFNNRIQEFSSSGAFVRKIGKAGSGNGEFMAPSGIDVDVAGNVWVADTGNHRVQELNSSGVYLGQFDGSAAGNAPLVSPVGLDVDSQGHIWISDIEGNSVVEFNGAGETLRRFGGVGSGLGQTSEPTALRVSASGAVVVADSGNARLDVWDAPKAGVVDSFGSQGAGEGKFEYPVGMARDPEGNFWVGDLNTTAGTHRIEKFDPTGNFIRQITAPGGGEGTIYVSGLATDTLGDLWVSDWSHARVEEFGKNGEFIRRFGTEGSGNGQLKRPEGIAVDAGGNVWVADTGNGRIAEFSGTGTFIKNVGSKGAAPGQLEEPNSVAISQDGAVWVTDSKSDRINEFGSDGSFVRRLGSEGSGKGQFEQPGGIAVDLRGVVWVGDQINNRVQGFTEAGDYVTEFGSGGSGVGQFALVYPIGIATGHDGGIWVTDYNNHRVQHWSLGWYPPTVSTLPAHPVAATSAMLRAGVDPNSGNTAVSFEYGTTTAYGQSTSASPKQVGAGEGPVTVSYEITGLSASSTYHFRAVAKNGEGTSYGEDQEVSTLGSWSLQSTPNPSAEAPNSALTSVSCKSSSSCLAVGYDNAANRGLAQAWNGEKWSALKGPAGRLAKGVSCGTTSACVAVDETLEHSAASDWWTLEGSTWTRTDAPLAVPSGGTLKTASGVSCTAKATCTAVGTYLDGSGSTKPLVERSSGFVPSWSVQSTASMVGEAKDVSCVSSTECVWVGWKLKEFNSQPVAELWNGEKWTALSPVSPAGATRATLEQVSCNAANSCTALGATLDAEGKAKEAFAEHWNGSTWSLSSSGLKGSLPLGDLNCTGSAACIAVGAESSKTLAQFWNGSSWSVQTTFSPEGKTSSLGGISCISSAVCTAVGAAASGGETGPLAEGWN
jgi:sugar lactone lactonase YvrE